MIESALAGYGTAILVAWASARLERWWTPTWMATIVMFAAMRRTAPTGAAVAVVASAASGSSIVGSAAAGTVAWLVAQCYVMLLLAARR